MLRAVLFALGAAVALTIPAPAQEPAANDPTTTPPLALGGLDPVALCEGKETAGDAEHTAAHGRFSYRFASAEQRGRFEADPERYAIQMGGGCARMAPLSGVGDPTRYAVFDGRVYIFASDSCRDGFLANPEQHLDRVDPPATGDAEQTAAGAALIESAIAGFGKPERFETLRSIRFRRNDEVERDGAKYQRGAELLVQFPGHIRQESWYGDWRRLDVLAGEPGFLREWAPDQPIVTWDHTTGQGAAVQRIWNRHPVAIVQARSRDDFVAVLRAEDEFFDRKFDVVDVTFDGCTSTVWIDRENQRIVRSRFDGRAGATRIGSVQVDYSAFREVDGITVPFAFEVTFDGKALGETRWDQIEVDAKLPADTFAR